MLEPRCKKKIKGETPAKTIFKRQIVLNRIQRKV